MISHSLARLFFSQTIGQQADSGQAGATSVQPRPLKKNEREKVCLGALYCGLKGYLYIIATLHTLHAPTDFVNPHSGGSHHHMQMCTKSWVIYVSLWSRSGHKRAFLCFGL
jgi:hypothetical protein